MTGSNQHLPLAAFFVGNTPGVLRLTRPEGRQPFIGDALNALFDADLDNLRPVFRRDAAATPHLAGGLVAAPDFRSEIDDGFPSAYQVRNRQRMCAHVVFVQ